MYQRRSRRSTTLYSLEPTNLVGKVFLLPDSFQNSPGKRKTWMKLVKKSPPIPVNSSSFRRKVHRGARGGHARLPRVPVRLRGRDRGPTTSKNPDGPRKSKSDRKKVPKTYTSTRKKLSGFGESPISNFRLGCPIVFQGFLRSLLAG